MLSEQELEQFERRLSERREELRWIIHDILIESKRDDYAKLAGQVHDSGEESVADMLVDIDLAQLGRKVEEVQDIEAAIQRFRDGVYGVCIDCEDHIVRDRLQAYPTAKRCIACQTRHENSRRGGKDATPSL
jgi:DnaK suppressor protein